METFKAFWHWQAANIDEVIALTQETGGNAVILKAAYQDPIYSTNLVRRADFPASAKKVKDAGLMLGAEIYNIPGAWAAEGDCLRDAIDKHGACFVVLNMEGPYEGERTENNARSLITRIRHVKRVWVCSDFRGNRLLLPYMRAVAPFIGGLMPMIYPRAFYPDTPWGDVQRAFDDAYWSWIRNRDKLHHNAREVPIIPAVQCYNRMDYEEMVGQIVLAWRWTKVLNKTTHGTSIYAAHDCNVRAKWGVRDGWEVVQAAIQPERQVPDWKLVAGAASAAASAAAGKAAHDAVVRHLKE